MTTVTRTTRSAEARLSGGDKPKVRHYDELDIMPSSALRSDVPKTQISSVSLGTFARSMDARTCDDTSWLTVFSAARPASTNSSRA
jgi:hypothetical protein